jgi:hypothetical protein
VNKDIMLELIHSELYAQYDDKTSADYALLGTLKTLVTGESLEKLIKRNGWDK